MKAIIWGVMFAGSYYRNKPDDIVYLAVNTYWEDVEIFLPGLPAGMAWRNIVDTFAKNPILKSADTVSGGIKMRPRSVRLFTA